MLWPGLLALLLIAALSTGLLLHSRSTPATVPGIAHPSTPTVVAHATPTPAATIYPSLGASYTGTVADLMTTEHTSLFLTNIQESNGNIQGTFQGLGLAGPFKGKVTTTGQVQFTVKINGGTMALVFNGNIKVGGDMAGTFTVVNQQGHSTGEYGLWNVSPSR